MANKKIQLINSGGDSLFPRTSIDNIMDADLTTAVSLPVLDSAGKIKNENLPDHVVSVVELLAITGTAPAECSVGDRYFNSAAGNGKIYTAVSANTWNSAGGVPEKNTIYVNLADEKLYRWNGTAMSEVSKQRAIATTIRGSGSATDDSVATEKAVRDAITSAAYELPNATTASAGGVTVDTAASHGISLNIEDGVLGISVDSATVGQIITGATAGAVTPEGLVGALSVGKAVDVTSLGTGNFDAASLPTAANYRGTFTLTKTSSSETLYYGFATFPKFAADKKYLWLMNVTNNGSVGISLQISSGAGTEILTPLQLYPSVPAGETVRVAFVFFGNAPKFEVRNSSSGGTYSLTISYCRQFEVTDLTHEAWEYLAGISDPDDLDLLYLIDECSVNPWTPILNMGTASAVAIQSGLAYKLMAQTGTHTLTVDTFPANCYGRDAHIELFVGETGAVQVQSPLILMDALTPNAVNNCTVKYRDGEARLYVDDTDYGYTVTITSGTASGSLYYGLTGSTADYVTFSNALNGSTVAIADAATVSRNLNILGNGMENTTISGIFGPASGKTMNVQDLTISGSTIIGTGTVNIDKVQFEDKTIADGTAAFHGLNRFNGTISGTGSVSFAAGGTLDFTGSSNSRTISGGCITVGNGMTIISAEGITALIDGCTFACLGSDVSIAGTDSIIVADSDLTDWRAINVSFASPLDASKAATVKLVGTTFTSASQITGQPMRIQLPAGSTNSFSGNTTSAGTHILQAPVILVGDSASAPSGSATIAYVGGSTVLSGIGTYVDREGGNDFMALTNVVDITSASGTGTGTLAGALTGENRWAKLDNSLTATASFPDGATVSDKHIITAEYEPVFAGTYSFGSGVVMTVDEETKTTSISSAAIVMSNLEIPKGATCAVGTSQVVVDGSTTYVPTGSMTVSSVCGGGTIDLGGTRIVVGSGGTMYASGCTITGGSAYGGGINGGAVSAFRAAIVELESCTFTGNYTNGGAGVPFYLEKCSSVILDNCVISGNSGTNGGGGVFDQGGDYNVISCLITGNTAKNFGGGTYVKAGTSVSYSKCMISGNTCGNGACGYIVGTATLTDCTTDGAILMAGGAVVNLGGLTAIEKITVQAGSSGTVTISSGAFINLTSSIAPGGGITVLEGGCTINSVFVSATPSETPYSSIVNSGGTLYIDGNPVE